MRIKRRDIQAFSLVEVVLALGIVVFAVFGLLGMLSTGLQNNHDSKEQLQAANIAEYICSVRRAAPTNDFTSTASSNPELGFPLPVLGTATNNIYNNSTVAPTYLTWNGLATNAANATFGLLFNITPSTNYPTTPPGVATVYLCLYWPPAAAPNVNVGHFELTTTFYLP